MRQKSYFDFLKRNWLSFKKEIKEIENLLKEIEEEESLVDIEKRLLISIKYLEESLLSKNLKKEEILQIIFGNTIGVFKETIDDIEHKISELKRKTAKEHEKLKKNLAQQRILLKEYKDRINELLGKIMDILESLQYVKIK